MANEIIDFSKQGNLGIGNDEAFASLGYKTDLSVNFCNGFNLQFEGAVMGNAGFEKHIAEFVKVLLEVEAGVEAGIQIAAQLSPKILDEIGVTIAVQAYLKAYIRTTLELSLTMDRILRIVKTKSKGLEYKIFEEFVKQIEIGAGVQANAQVALTAAAEVVCRARLFEQKGKEAGFDFRMNAEAAFVYGAGVDFFLKGRFNDISQFFRSSKNHIINEIEEFLPTSANNKITDFAITSCSLALDLIINASVEEFSNKKSLNVQFIKNFTSEFLLEELLEAYHNFLENLGNQVVTWFESMIYQLENLNKVSFRIHEILNKIKDVKSLKDIVEILDISIQLLNDLKFYEVAVFENTATHIYALGYLIDSENKGLWEKLPEYAKRRYKAISGKDVNVLKSNVDAYIYLEKSCFSGFLKDYANASGYRLGIFLNAIYDNGLSVVDFLQLIYEDIDTTREKKLLQIGFRFLETTFDKHVLEPFQLVIKPLFERSNFGKEYYDIVFEDSINNFSRIFIPMMKTVFIDNSNKTNIEQLTYLSNRFLVGFAAKNISFISNELLNFAADNITHSITTCENGVKNGKFSFIAQKFFYTLEDKIDAIIPLPTTIIIPNNLKEKVIDATEEFVLDIMKVAKLSMGRETWTEERIDILTATIEKMIANPDDNQLDLRTLTPDEIEAKIKELKDCSFLPDLSKYYLEDMSEVLQVIGWQQFKAFLIHMPSYSAEYIIKLIKILFINQIQEVLDAIKDLIDAAYNKLNELIKDIESLLIELENKINKIINELDQVINNLYSETKKAIEKYFDLLILDLDFSDMNWLNQFIDWITFWDGSDKDKAKKVVLELKKQALSNLNQQGFERGMMNLGKDDGFDYDTVQNWISNHILTDTIKDKLGKVNFKTDQAVQNVWMDVNTKVSEESNELREKSWEYVARNNQHSRETDRLSLLRSQNRIYESKYEELENLKKSNIQVKSPLPIDITKDDIPIYDKYVYLEIDFDKVDIDNVIKNQFHIVSEDLIDIDNNLSSNPLIWKISNGIYKQDTSLLQFKILLNGKELDLHQFTVKKQSLSIHITKKHLKQGSNQLTVMLIPPSSYKKFEFIKQIEFFCDLYSKKFPSNAIYIDPLKTIINSKGNDHEDALNDNLMDKEVIAITNNTSNVVRLEGWKLSDAAGHTYVFEKNDRIKPGGTYNLYVGKTPSGSDSWAGYYGNKLIALLNNKGEFLKLKNNEDKIISYIYTGYPNSNKQINFLK